MTETQRRLEQVRRRAMDIELPLRTYFRDLLAIRPDEITPESFADLQSSADDLNESIRRCAQGLYDLIEHVASETAPGTPDGERAERLRLIRERIRDVSMRPE